MGFMVMRRGTSEIFTSRRTGTEYILEFDGTTLWVNAPNLTIATINRPQALHLIEVADASM